MTTTVWLSPADQRHDFQPIAVGQPLLGVLRPRNDLEVYFHGDATEREFKLLQELGHGGWLRQLARLAVDDNI